MVICAHCAQECLQLAGTAGCLWSILNVMTSEWPLFNHLMFWTIRVLLIVLIVKLPARKKMILISKNDM